ncbi:MAG: sodium:solute symporter family protein [Candidatus Hydrogenedentes bacterium]|nr:sodium:solute symporter family protein [Candidatus Hydrogenedentota bacterium]
MTASWIMWAIVAVYLTFVFFKGVLKVRQVSDSDDFLVAGRNIGWFFLLCTMGATVVGGGASIGAIARTYDWGVLMLLVSMGWYLNFIFAGLWIAPRFREAKLYTVAGYFGHRFGEGPRFAALLLSITFSVFIVAAQMAAFGSVVAAIAPEFSDAANVLRWAIIIGGTLVVTYSTAGGLLAVIHTDVYQFTILIAGFAITLLFCIPDLAESYDGRTGKFVPLRFSTVDIRSPEALAASLARTEDPVACYLLGTVGPLPDKTGLNEPQFTVALVEMMNEALTDSHLYAPERFAQVSLSRQTKELLEAGAQGKRLRRLNLSLLQDAFPEAIDPNREINPSFFRVHGDKGWLFLVTTFLAFLFGECFAPGYATRYCVGKNIRETRIGIAGAGVFLALVFPVVLFFIALYARVHYPAIDPQQALPCVVYQLHNPVISGLIVGALLMAVMSSADSALNSATAIFVKDLFEHQFGWRDDENGRLLRLARLCSLALGGVSILVAVLWPDIIGLLLFTYHVWAPAVIVPVCVGAFSPRVSRRQNRIVLLTMVLATAVTLVYRLPQVLERHLGWRVLPDALQDLTARFDPAVFGVAMSLLIFGGLTTACRVVHGTE